LRDKAAIQREIAARDRRAESAARRTRQTAQSLSLVLRNVAEALDASATLAAEHADRQEQAGRSNTVAEEPCRRPGAQGCGTCSRPCQEMAHVRSGPEAVTSVRNATPGCALAQFANSTLL
jgi:hypothetical protein